jgi:hypothetical protein
MARAPNQSATLRVSSVARSVHRIAVLKNVWRHGLRVDHFVSVLVCA